MCFSDLPFRTRVDRLRCFSDKIITPGTKDSRVLCGELAVNATHLTMVLQLLLIFMFTVHVPVLECEETPDNYMTPSKFILSQDFLMSIKPEQQASFIVWAVIFLPDTKVSVGA